MVLLMTAALLRESEAVALTTEDLSVEIYDPSAAQRGRARGEEGEGENPIDVLVVRIVRSKTDQEARGDTIIVADNEGDTPLKPVSAYLNWMDIRDSTELFDEVPSIPPSPYAFQNLKTGAGLSPDTPRGIIKRWLTAIGEDPAEYGGHSARSGGATAAANSGIAIDLLRRHGRWKSDAVYVYIHDSRAARIAVSRAALAD